jgi:hypothetical protein
VYQLILTVINYQTSTIPSPSCVACRRMLPALPDRHRDADRPRVADGPADAVSAPTTKGRWLCATDTSRACAARARRRWARQEVQAPLRPRPKGLQVTARDPQSKTRAPPLARRTLPRARIPADPPPPRRQTRPRSPALTRLSLPSGTCSEPANLRRPGWQLRHPLRSRPHHPTPRRPVRAPRPPGHPRARATARPTGFLFEDGDRRFRDERCRLLPTSGRALRLRSAAER